MDAVGLGWRAGLGVHKAEPAARAARDRRRSSWLIRSGVSRSGVSLATGSNDEPQTASRRCRVAADWHVDRRAWGVRMTIPTTTIRRRQRSTTKSPTPQSPTTAMRRHPDRHDRRRPDRQMTEVTRLAGFSYFPYNLLFSSPFSLFLALIGINWSLLSSLPERRKQSTT